METAAQFQLFNTAILLPWLLMIFAPNWYFTKTLIHNYIFPFIYGFCYTIYIAFFLSQSNEAPDFMSLAGIMKLFSVEPAVLVGWIHYLAFDLFVGSWIFQDAKSKVINHFLLIPCLLLCFMFGPAGLVFYMILKKILGK
jgi:Domain of unknown function (DUF4281)